MSVVIVDWLGRGGIAQTSEAWAVEAAELGIETCVVTRGGREIEPRGFEVASVSDGRSRLLTHRRVVGAAVRTIATRKPDVVVVQNYVIPTLERPVHRAARDAGSDLVFVVHDHRLHSRLAGSNAGLPALLRGADDVVAHSRFVGQSVAESAGCAVSVIPHPIPVGLLARSGWDRDTASPDPGKVALQFGVVKRRYKGVDLVESLAASGVDGWQFVIAGTGAPARAVGLRAVPGFLSAATLVDEVARSRATLLPYRLATQSGTIPLAHVLGSVPVAYGVGGIVEQIDHGRTGLLLPPESDLAAWRGVLERLGDDVEYTRLADEGRTAVEDEHGRFRDAVKRRLA